MQRLARNLEEKVLILLLSTGGTFKKIYIHELCLRNVNRTAPVSLLFQQQSKSLMSDG